MSVMSQTIEFMKTHPTFSAFQDALEVAFIATGNFQDDIDAALDTRGIALERHEPNRGLIFRYPNRDSEGLDLRNRSRIWTIPLTRPSIISPRSELPPFRVATIGFIEAPPILTSIIVTDRL
jgi:hypothetical protein